MSYSDAVLHGSKLRDTAPKGNTGIYPQLPDKEDDYPALPSKTLAEANTNNIPTASSPTTGSHREDSQKGSRKDILNQKHIVPDTSHAKQGKNQQQCKVGNEQRVSGLQDIGQALVKSISQDSDSQEDGQKHEIPERSDFNYGPSDTTDDRDQDPQNIQPSGEQQSSVFRQDTNPLAGTNRQVDNRTNLSQAGEQSDGSRRYPIQGQGSNKGKGQSDRFQDSRKDCIETEAANVQGNLDTKDQNRGPGLKDQEMNQKTSFQQSNQKRYNDHSKEYKYYDTKDNSYSYQSKTQEEDSMSGARPRDNHQRKHGRGPQQESTEWVEYGEEAQEIDPVLKERFKDDNQSKFEYFWKNEDIYSQWHRTKFTVDDKTYTSTEQFMMHRKAILFEDYKTASKIMQTQDPRRQKKLGRQVQNFDEDLWKANCEAIVEEGNTAKFQQNVHLLNILFSTNPKILVEASPLDRIWGIGLFSDDPNAWNRATWCGENKLGKVLTRVRNKLMLQMNLITKEERDRQIAELER
ncbi:protein starmaker-like [Ylistrum balloti]|uniref:protein starmaker-like n=1 Tax=Ylistrum balloti TaxID=509963 RepID=UPI002905C40E|nr:protein starmaker-like [Ylistrum balloti]